MSVLVFQPGLCPGDWLQDMERLSEELLLPLLSQPALGRLWDSLGCVLCVVVEPGVGRGGGSFAPCRFLRLAPWSIPGGTPQPEGNLNP